MEVTHMGDINAPEFAHAKALSDFVVFVKNAESVFVETNVLLNDKGQLFIDFTTPEHMYALCTAITKHLMLQDWKVNGSEVFLYTDGRAYRAILTPYPILPYSEK
jgi:hypothetical protein